MQFTQLDGPDGRVLIPRTVEVVSITEARGTPDTFWLEGVFPGDERKSIQVKGPIDTILTALGAETTASDTGLRKEVERLHEQRDHLENMYRQALTTVNNLRDEARRYADELRARKMLDASEGQWDDPNLVVDSCPLLWSTVRITADRMGPGPFWEHAFVTALGTSGQGFVRPLGKPYTNIRESGRIPSGQLWNVYGIKVEFLRGSAEAVAAFREHTVLQWDFTQTNIDICPLGAMTWDDTGRTGRYLFADPKNLRAQLAAWTAAHERAPRTVAAPVVPSEDEAEAEGVTSELQPLFDDLPERLGHQTRLQAGGPLRPLVTPAGALPLPSIPASVPLFRYGGRTGVALPGNTTFAVLLQGDGDALQPVLRDDEAIIRISLAGMYRSEIEIG